MFARVGRVIIAVIAMVIVPSVAGFSDAQPPKPPPVTARELATLKSFFAGDRNYLRDGGSTSQALAMVGRDDLAAPILFAAESKATCQSLKTNGELVDPLQYVAAAATKTRVTMINEAHDAPQSRAFIADLAAALRKENYSAYGAETFNDNIGENGPRWPLLSDGFYSREPIFGRLIRRLRTLGYKLFPYEFSGGDVQASPLDHLIQREKGQASNLAAQIRKNYADTKVLVHVGYAHLTKRQAPGNTIKMMGQYFVEATDIQPLTVDQTRYWSDSDRNVVCDAAALNLAFPIADIFIGTPRPTFERNRPTWRLKMGDRLVEIPSRLMRPNELAIYEARYRGEPDTTTPVDRILVNKGETIPLSLPSGEFQVEVWTEDEGWSSSTMLTVASH